MPTGQTLELKRCAIYTRKSFDVSFDREFNSLETQRAICSAYITSQSPRGWREVPAHYDDAGRSGATLDRPQLQILMTDIERGLIDAVVVYKLDRISRSLLDFVRLTDFFERHHVSFISITQSFDTSDSMGRLILNVLLTFAQFEREIMADRIRDKKRLMKNSGRWPGGTTPLGYTTRNLILRIHPREAESVRFIFQRFAELGNYAAVAAECGRMRVKGRRHRNKDRRIFNNGSIGSASIRHILRNPAYIGQLKVAGGAVAGLHPAIIDRPLWDRVQHLLQKIAERARRHPSDHRLLCRILYDCHGRLMTIHRGPMRHGECIEYYCSLQNDWGRKHGEPPLWARADSLESLVCGSLQQLLADNERLRAGLLKVGCFDERLELLTASAETASFRLDEMDRQNLRAVIHSIVGRIELARDRMQAVLRWREIERYLAWDGIGNYVMDEPSSGRCSETLLVDVPLSSVQCRRKMRLPIQPRVASDARPSPVLLKLIEAAREAQRLVERNRTRSLAELATPIRRSETYFVRLLRLNYLAPDIITAILDGTQPVGLTKKKLMYADLPLDWELQRRMLGFGSRTLRETAPSRAISPTSEVLRHSK